MYLKLLRDALAEAFERLSDNGDPQLLCYLAGADPFREDQLGGLALTKEGIERRDAAVFGAARRRKIPVMVTLAGGYARRVSDTVEIHCNTVRALREAM